ncbi:hypothetical protein AAG570_007594 [Ranatra chinensis]|uniref:Uncharacterized protein n=1 Tax=Ranatra chinensis TaxID=642074 RepID=A0ABD0YHV1_9HEMI
MVEACQGAGIDSAHPLRAAIPSIGNNSATATRPGVTERADTGPTSLQSAIVGNKLTIFKMILKTAILDCGVQPKKETLNESGVFSQKSSVPFSMPPGRCGHESPCEQLCYELHDGMFECDCKRGFVLHHDGYSCLEHVSALSGCG